MSSTTGLPLAIKVFACSLLAGVVGGYGGYRVAWFLAVRFLRGEYAEMLAVAIAMLAALVVGVCSAITAGVLAGRSAQSKGINL